MVSVDDRRFDYSEKNEVPSVFVTDVGKPVGWGHPLAVLSSPFYE